MLTVLVTSFCAIVQLCPVISISTSGLEIMETLALSSLWKICSSQCWHAPGCSLIPIHRYISVCSTPMYRGLDITCQHCSTAESTFQVLTVSFLSVFECRLFLLLPNNCCRSCIFLPKVDLFLSYTSYVLEGNTSLPYDPKWRRQGERMTKTWSKLDGWDVRHNVKLVMN